MKYNLIKIGDFCRTGSGGTPSRKKLEEYYEGDIPWVKSGELRESTITSTEEKITSKALKETSVKLVPKDALLVAMYGATIGRVAILGIEATTNQAVCHIIPEKEKADQRYLFYALQKQVPYWLNLGVGGAQPNISQQIIKETKIPLPPIAEQRRIAAILDKADGIRRKRQEAIRLTEELGRSLFLDMFGDPVTNSKGLETKPLAKIATFLGGGTPSRANEEYFKGNICWASSKDMGNEVLLDTQEHITQEAIAKSSTKIVPSGTLLVVVKSKILMRYLPVVRTAVDTCFNQDIKAIIPQDLSLNRYLQAHLKLGQETLLRQARGVNTEGLTLEHLRKYPVLMPPKAMINKFISISKKLDEMIVIKKYSLEESENLFNSLLQRAFRGEL